MQKQQYNISQAELATRLKHRRIVEKLTQQQAAEASGMTRTTLVAIEQGQRSVKPDELQQLAYLYRTSVNWLLGRDARQVHLSVQFRKNYKCPKKEQDQASSLITKLVEAELALEDILGIENRRECTLNQDIINCRNYTDEIISAQEDADALRQQLNIGISPIQDMQQLIEFDLNMRLYIRPLHGKIAGMWASAGNYGECVLLNFNHPPERKNFSAAHELGHFFWSVRNKKTEAQRSKSTEKYADCFASNFLMPKEAVEKQVNKLKEESSLTIRSLILMSGIFNVSIQAMERRLANLNIIHPGWWKAIKIRGGISKEQKDTALSKADLNKENKYYMQRIYRLATEASKKALLSEGQLSKMLCLDRVELRTILQEYDEYNTSSC